MTAESDEFFSKKEGEYDANFKKYIVGNLANTLLGGNETLDYRVLVVADACCPPSPWTDEIKIVIDHDRKLVRLHVFMV